MLCVQLMGYVLTFLTVIAIIILYWGYNVDTKIISQIVIGVWLFEIVAFFITQFITDGVSKRRLKNNYKPPKA